MSIKRKKNTASIDHASMTFSNVSNAASLYNDEKIVNNPSGHGFAAENANHFYDVCHGRDAKIIGYDNAKNGADRLVDGVHIQTKYCVTGSKCVGACFDNTKGFKYLNADGSPMQIEVPCDKYDDAVQAMRSRIERGQVPNVTNPDEAENIIRQGHFTYEQVKNIAKAGTIESLSYDATSGAIIAATSFGLTTIISLATAVWSGKNIEEALDIAVGQGLKVGGVSFFTAICAGQASKLGLGRFLVRGSKIIVNAMGDKVSAAFVNAFRCGKNIYGAAAMKSAAKILRNNVITALASLFILSVPDITRKFRGRISGGQLFKNVTIKISLVVGSTTGWFGGAAFGAWLCSFVPFLGTFAVGTVGGLLGALTGGSVFSFISKTVLDTFIEDDHKQMISIIESVYADLGYDYLINEREAHQISNKLQDALTITMLQDMYASQDSRFYAKTFLKPYFINVTSKREFIALPSCEQMSRKSIVKRKCLSILNKILNKISYIIKKKIIEESVVTYFLPLRNIIARDNAMYIKGHPYCMDDKVFRTAINAYAQGIKKSDILILFDPTIMQSDEGVIITNSTIYLKNDSAKYKVKLDIFSLEYAYIEWKFLSNVVYIEDTNGMKYHLGSLVASMEEVEQLDRGFTKLLERIKELRNAKLLKCMWIFLKQRMAKLFKCRL